VTDTEFDKQKKRVKKYVDKWFSTLGLGWYEVDFEWSREFDGETAGRCVSSWQYRSATITFFLPKLAQHDDETIERCVVHEMSHILLSSLAQNQNEDSSGLADQINEYATESVTNALLWSRMAGEKTLNNRRKK
jgi:hypothetical protein